MSEAVAVVVIQSVVLLAGIALTAYYSAKQHKALGERVQGLHLELNSRLTQLIDETGKASHAAGREEGRQERGQTDRPVRSDE